MVGLLCIGEAAVADIGGETVDGLPDELVPFQVAPHEAGLEAGVEA
jgi:hypothetical protein